MEGGALVQATRRIGWEKRDAGQMLGRCNGLVGGGEAGKMPLSDEMVVRGMLGSLMDHG